MTGNTLGEVGLDLVRQLLEVLPILPLRSQSTSGVRCVSVFPLPTSRDVLSSLFDTPSPCKISWLNAICLGLNSLWGETLMFAGPPNMGSTGSIDAPGGRRE